MDFLTLSLLSCYWLSIFHLARIARNHVIQGKLYLLDVPFRQVLFSPAYWAANQY